MSNSNSSNGGNIGSYLHFFIGTPKRLMTTMLCIALVTVMVNPGLLQLAVNRLLAELAPLLGPALTLIIVFAGLRTIVFGRGGKK